ncbi:MAG: LacI family transcriptional regulator [Bacteroidia bacterium]|jgi:LacI family transcriptional regulator
MPKATINDVAELAGVSIKTVSRVVNLEPNVRESTREKVEKAVAKLKYRPNLSARNLASHRSHLIGLLYDDPAAYELPSAGYIIRLQQGVLSACKAVRYDLLIHPCNFQDQGLGNEIETMIEQRRPVGVILAAPLSNMPKIVQAIEKTGTPMVQLSPGKHQKKHSTVSTNDKEISAEMTRYLASLGHQRIAFISGDPEHRAVANRMLGYQDGLRDAGLSFSQQLVIAGDNSIGSGEVAAKRLLSWKNPPTAIFAANDDMAVGVLLVASRLGVDVPGKLSVAGFDDISLARQVSPALTTIRQPLVRMAEYAAQMLIKGVNGTPGSSSSEVIPAELKIRDSTGPVGK